MITVVTMLWTDPKSRKPYTYDDRYPITLKKQVDKYFTLPHDFICITDHDTKRMEEHGIRCLELDRTTHRSNTRYMKLMLFSKKFAEQVPGTILYLDLDGILTKTINHLVEEDVDLKLWRNPNFTKENKRAFFNTSIIQHKTGTLTYLYDKFRDVFFSKQYQNSRKGGTDQKYISHVIDHTTPYWKGNEYIWGLGRIGDANPNTCSTLPKEACIVFTPGRRTQYTKETQQKHPWLKDYIL